MIVGIFHQGSGLGNQLHRYVATRAKATDLGVDWGMLSQPDDSGKEEGFKGKSFMDVPYKGKDVFNKVIREGNRYRADLGKYKNWTEKKVVENGVDIRSYDPEFNFIKENTIIDGEFQDERYWEHREKEVGEWLKVEPLEMPDDLCVIGFRGGEFALYPDLFLTKEYWKEAMGMIQEINPNMKFEIHTDDPLLADNFFTKDESFPFKYPVSIIHDIGLNWRSMRYAKYAIIANSSFFIFPRWLNKGLTLAPRYWGRRNTKIWSLPQNYYKRFTYI